MLWEEADPHFGDVGVGQRLAVGKMRDQRADPATEQAVDEAL